MRRRAEIEMCRQGGNTGNSDSSGNNSSSASTHSGSSKTGVIGATIGIVIVLLLAILVLLLFYRKRRARRQKSKMPLQTPDSPHLPMQLPDSEMGFAGLDGPSLQNPFADPPSFMAGGRSTSRSSAYYGDAALPRTPRTSVLRDSYYIASGDDVQVRSDKVSVVVELHSDMLGPNL